MKAIIYTEYGTPDVLDIREVENPVPNENEVLIKIMATTVNRTDCGFLRGKPLIARLFIGLFRPKVKTLGNEFAGVIEAVGKDVTEFKPGDKVFGYDDSKFGSHAEYKVLEANKGIAKLPENCTYKEAAPLLEGAHYALMYMKAAHIEKGTKILINGGTGGIGSAGVQLASYFGAEITATCATEHRTLVKSLGASTVIDYTKDDFTKCAEQFDVVFDAVGKSSFRKCKRILKKKGIYTSTELGNGSQNPFLAMVTPLFKGKKVLFPIPTVDKKDVLFLKQLVENGKFKPVIDRVYSFENIPKAYRYVESGQKVGNVVITVQNEE